MTSNEECRFELDQIGVDSMSEVVLTDKYRDSSGSSAPQGIDAGDWLNKCRLFIEFENGQGHRAWSAAVLLDGVDLRPGGQPSFTEPGIDRSLRKVLRQLNNRMKANKPPLN